MTVIDAHQHFWMTGRGDYGWLTEESGDLYRDYLPDDLLPLMQKTGVDGTILVQAAPTVAETQFLLSIANDHDFVKGVVGWIDFESPTVWDDLDQLADHEKLVVGVPVQLGPLPRLVRGHEKDRDPASEVTARDVAPKAGAVLEVAHDAFDMRLRSCGSR